MMGLGNSILYAFNKASFDGFTSRVAGLAELLAFCRASLKLGRISSFSSRPKFLKELSNKNHSFPGAHTKADRLTLGESDLTESFSKKQFS